MSNIKYYYAPGACSLAPHILLRETGVDFEAIRVANLRVSPIPEDFRRINPKMRVPVISIGDETITEAPAIITMVASLAPEKNLLGRTPLETVRVYEWMNWLSGTVHSLAFKPIFKPILFTADPAAYEGIKTKARETIKECFELIEGKLEGVYAVGGAYTAVDAYLLVFYRWGNVIGVNMKVEYPKYTELIANLVQRAAVKTTLEVEEIESSL